MALEPILIMALPRSGSSMTAGIFAAHGVWVGSVRPPAKTNPKGSFENRDIKAWLIKRQDDNVRQGRLADPIDGFRKFVESIVMTERPWLFKGSALYWTAFHEFQPTFVVCRRDPEASFQSCRATGLYGRKESDQALRANIALHHEQMDYLVREHNAAEVDTQAVSQGDFTTIQKAIEHCGLTFDDKITDDWVEPDWWHFASAQRTG